MMHVARFLLAAIISSLPAYVLFIENGYALMALAWLFLTLFIVGILIVARQIFGEGSINTRTSDPSMVLGWFLELFPSFLGAIGFVAIFSMQLEFSRGLYFGMLLLLPIMILDFASLRMYLSSKIMNENFDLLHQRMDAMARGEEFDIKHELERSVARLDNLAVHVLGNGWFPIGYLLIKYVGMILGAWTIYKLVIEDASVL